MVSFSGVLSLVLCLLLFCFVLLRFRLYAFVEAAALPSIVLRHAGTPIATRVYFFLSFSEYIFYISLYGEYVIRSFLPDYGVSPPYDHGLDFRHQLM